jgi:iron complex transport system ATP-binding protein
MADTAVELTRLGHAYVPGRWVFRGYNASVRRGAVAAVLGPNGRGKTTLLRNLLGVLPPSEGRVAVQGRLAFVPQLFEASFDYTVLDMVLMGRARQIGVFSQPSAQDREVAMRMLERVGQHDLAQRNFSQLSGGQRQLVIFARALAAEADILVLDEPTSSLDLKNQALVLDWIQRLATELRLTVIFTTHHPHHALAVADEVLLMLGEQQLLSGAANDVLSESNLLELYGVPLKRIEFQHAGQRVETFAPVLRRS